ncbi:MAG TPA: NAD(P)-binding domain-containing protein, partial [Chryseosolibacter sp.]
KTKLDELKSQSAGKVNTGTFSDAASFGEMVVLAVKGSVASAVVESIGPALGSKIVLDTTNPIADTPPQNGVLGFFTDLSESLMERLQKLVPTARFVKTFNSVGSGLMVDPGFKEKPTMFICGNDEEAKKVVSTLLEEIGWESADMGKAEAARAIEPLCILWCIPGFLRNEWTHAFKLLKK